MNCFVIMPFSETEHRLNNETIKITTEEWEYIFDNWIKKAVESYKEKKIICKRSETVQGNFVKGIIHDIYNSELAIADLTGQKPNVYYELGVRHSLRLGTIIMTQDYEALPSDLGSYYCFSYKYTNKSHEYDNLYKEFEKKLHDQISSVLKNKNASDNPVSDYLNLKHYYQVKQQEKEAIIISKITKQVDFHFTFVRNLFTIELAKKQNYLANKSIFFTFLDFYQMDSSISQLFNYEFEYFDELKLNKLKDFYLEFRQELFKIHQFWEGTRSNIGKRNIEALIGLLEKFMAKEDEKSKLLGEIMMELIVPMNEILIRNN